MAQFDLSLPELERYRANLQVPSDFDEFWATTLQQARAVAEPPQFTAVDNGLRQVDTYDVTFSGFAADPVKAWLHLPAGASGPLPAVVQYLGYSGGRGLSHEVGMWSLAGYAHLVVDTRGQGWGRTAGATPDPGGSGPAAPGYLTRGITDPRDYYYRRVFTDAVLAVDAVRSHEAVAAGTIALTGMSQGGGIALAAGALCDDIAAVMPDVPFLCDFARAITLVDTDPYDEIVTYLRVHRGHVEQVHRTLSYFDGVAMASRGSAPALFSVGLMDDTCPPSTVYAAHNAWAGPRQIRVYPFNGHEGGGAEHQRVQLDWLAAQLARVSTENPLAIE
jgi:cephalosporin-C deacetylase